MTLVEVDPLVGAQHAAAELTKTERARVEILDGMVVVNPPPTLAHAELTDRIYRLFVGLAPAELLVNCTGIGVYLSDSASSTYQEPDVAVYRRAVSSRLTGADVELVVEVVSPANRRLVDYEAAVVNRAIEYGISWVLIVDGDAESARWWHDGTESETGPDWIAAADLASHLWS